ncbi:recombinase family protein [Gluconobacter sp. Dm-62]|uniref:recombinase family protein n=1 Tax=Gluconobacter sp. Dm-62 TaxID=2799804 RepID=UPI001B8B9BFE|nr:recombinase family protein [Gluconobacter sp. Dm-62]MBS1104299.1 recombinase family protein [Gluconobacter sp. Dm-62]
MNRFISYYRVSTKKQKESGLGLQAQKDTVKNYVNHKNGILLQEFREVESGKKNDRPMLTQAMEQCRLYGATLLIAKLDRLSRDAVFLLQLQRGDVPFTACDMPDANVMTVGIMALLAQQEREMISRRTKEGLAVLKAGGKKLGGWRKKSHRFSQQDIEKATVARNEKESAYRSRVIPVIRDLRSSGMSYRKICDQLTELGIKTYHKKSNWHPNVVRSLFLL